MLAIVDDDPEVFDCKPCNGAGVVGDDWCSVCGGDGNDWFDRSRLFTLAANLAVAGALCAAFYDGFREGFCASGEGFNGEYAPRLTDEGFTVMAQDNAIGGNYGPTWKPGHALTTTTAGTE